MSRVNKRRGIYLFLVVESLLFGGVYFLGPQGMQHVFRVKNENAVLEQEIQALKTDVALLDQNLYAWQHDAFYQEKIAREHLQMARKGDEIYYLK